MTRRLKSDFTATRWSPGNAYIKAANEAALQHSDQAGVDRSRTESISQTTEQPNNPAIIQRGIASATPDEVIAGPPSP